MTDSSKDNWISAETRRNQLQELANENIIKPFSFEIYKKTKEEREELKKFKKLLKTK